MKVAITYDVNEYEHEYEVKRLSESYIKKYTNKNYSNIKFSFERYDDDEILDTITDIINNSDDSSEIKLENIRKTLGQSTNNVYEFDNETQQCEIYYMNEPFLKLYIEIDIFTDGFSNEEIIPVKIHTTKPEHYYRLLKYKYQSDQGYRYIRYYSH